MPRKTTTHTFVLISGDEAINLADSGHYIFVTHDGLPHADDVAACAAWAIGGIPPENRDCCVLRTRDQTLIQALSRRPNVVIADVGGKFDPVANIFDHHFNNCEKREDGLPYSSFGLLVRHMGGTAGADAQLVRHIDAADNGVKGYSAPEWWPRFNKEDPMGGSVAWAVRHAAPCHDDGSPVAGWEFDAQFCVLAKAFEKIFMTPDEVLKKHGLPFGVQRMFEEYHAATARATVYSRKRVQKQIQDILEHDGILCLKQFEVAALDELALLPEDDSLKYLVYPGPGGRQWMVQQIPKTVGSFEGRLPLPEAWAGLEGEKLAEITGVEDAVFCHRGRFICGARSWEGALSLAHGALAVEAKRLADLREAEEAKEREAAEAAEAAERDEAAQAEVLGTREQMREDGPGVDPFAEERKASPKELSKDAELRSP